LKQKLSASHVITGIIIIVIIIITHPSVVTLKGGLGAFDFSFQVSLFLTCIIFLHFGV